jgi:hypothetical protein
MEDIERGDVDLQSVSRWNAILVFELMEGRLKIYNLTNSIGVKVNNPKFHNQGSIVLWNLTIKF